MGQPHVAQLTFRVIAPSYMTFLTDMTKIGIFQGSHFILQLNFFILSKTIYKVRDTRRHIPGEHRTKSDSASHRPHHRCSSGYPLHPGELNVHASMILAVPLSTSSTTLKQDLWYRKVNATQVRGWLQQLCGHWSVDFCQCTMWEVLLSMC